MADSPTSRTLKWLRSHGYTAGVVERWNPHSRTRQDLFGFVDIVAFDDDSTIAIQCTSVDGMRARRKKLADEPNVSAWLQGQFREVWLVGWKKWAKPVDGKYWRPKVERIE